jgi:hypothetical protein
MLGSGKSFVALGLSVRGWPPNTGSSGRGAHNKGQGATFPDGSVKSKVYQV